MTSTLTAAEQMFLDQATPKLEDMDNLVPSFQAVLYGEVGVGKTVAAMMLAAHLTPTDKDILHVDSAQGYKVRRNHPKLMERSMLRLPWGNRATLLALANAIAKKQGKFSNIGAVILDESSSMALSNLRTITAANTRYKKSDENPASPNWPDYNINQNQFNDVAKAFAVLDGVHVIHTAHEANTKSGEFKAAYSPGLAALMLQPMDVVARVSVNKAGQRTFQLDKDGKAICKSRVGGLNKIESFGRFAEHTKEWLAGNIETVDINENEELVPEVIESAIVLPSEDEADIEGMEI
jgi:hypothetical protein